MRSLKCRTLIVGILFLVVSHWSVLASPANAPSGSNERVLQGTLRAGVYEKLMEAGLDCRPEGKESLPARVNRVKFHSQAEIQGMQKGDRIVGVLEAKDSVDLSLERGGEKYSLNLDTFPEWGKGWKNPAPEIASHVAPLSSPPAQKERPPENAAFAMEPMLANVSQPDEQAKQSGTEPVGVNGSDAAVRLSVADQRKILAEHEVVVMIDKSGSMNTPDCAGGLSRWDWCREQATALSKESEDYLPDGITLVVFANDYQVYQYAHVKDIADVFKNLSPGGSTNTGSALWDRLRAYLSEKTRNPRTTKPLVVAVITDGEPTDGRTTAEAIISATAQIRDPSEISIIFLQVGSDASGTALIDELADKLVYEGARYDVVEHETYPQLLKMGLRTAIVSAILAPHVKAQPYDSSIAHNDSFFEHLRSRLEKKWFKHQSKSDQL